MSNTILVKQEGRAVILTLNRPDKLNALSSELLRTFHRKLLELDRDDGVGAIIVTGAGDRAFTAGMDLSEAVLGRTGDEPSAAFMQICGATAAWTDGHEWRGLRDKQYTYAIYRVDNKELLFDNIADPLQLTNLACDPQHAPLMEKFRTLLAEKMAAIGDNFEACTWYRDHWTDGDRNIVRSATQDFEAAR